MKPKAIITVLLLAFVAVSVVMVAMKETGTKPAQAKSSSTGESVNVAEKSDDPGSPPERQIIAYYFHTNVRCPSCVKIENYTRKAIEENFTDELKSGELVFRMVNTDEEPNAHFVDDYQLVTKTVVVVEMKKGKQVRWDKLEKTWELLGDEDKFCAYIVEGMQAYLDGKPDKEAEA